MPIIEQRDLIEMMGRNRQALANLRIISDAVAGHPCDSGTIVDALEVVRVNSERAGRQARRMLRSIEADAARPKAAANALCGSEVWPDAGDKEVGP